MHPDKAVDVVVESTDSDYIMIGMLHYEKQCKTVERDGAGLGRVSLRRMHCRGKDHAAGGAKKGGGGSAEGATKPKREMEYVHIPLLCEVMSTLVQELFTGGTPMQCLSVIVAFAGTDFCRHTPRLGAHRMWELLPLVLRTNDKINLFKENGSITVGGDDSLTKRNVLDEVSSVSLSFSLSLVYSHTYTHTYTYTQDVVCDTVISMVYAEVYSKHVSTWDRKTFESLSRCIKNESCKLSDAVKLEFPSLQMMGTMVRNVSWNLLYWMAAAEGDMKMCPSPIHPMYGYAIDGENGRPQWLDIVLLNTSEPACKKKKK